MEIERFTIDALADNRRRRLSLDFFRRAPDPAVGSFGPPPAEKAFRGEWKGGLDISRDKTGVVSLDKLPSEDFSARSGRRCRWFVTRRANLPCISFLHVDFLTAVSQTSRRVSCAVRQGKVT